MDRSLLLQWLELPPGTWPPEPYTLLGLSETSTDARQAEARTLSLMNKLRSHQLKHPELVTEGMNRLAEALLHVSSHQARPVEARHEPIAIVPEKPTLAKPKPIEASPRSDQPIEPLPTFKFPPIKSDDRRRCFHDLAQLRRLRENLKRLTPTIGNVHNRLSSPGDIYQYLAGMEHLDSSLMDYKPSNWSVGKLMPTITLLCRQAHRLSIMRGLGIEQRQRLSEEWVRATGALNDYYAESRAELIATRKKSPTRRQSHIVFNRLYDWETILCLTGLLILAIVIGQMFLVR